MTLADQRRDPSLLISVAALVIIVAGLRAAASFFLPFLVALFLALLSFPLVESLQRRGLRLSLAVALTFIADLAVLLIFGLVVTQAVARFTRAAPGYWELLGAKFEGWRIALGERLADREIALEELIDFGAVSAADLTNVLGGIGDTVRGVASVVSFSVLVLLTMVCFLYEAVGFPDKIKVAFERGGARTEYFTSITREIQRYLGIKTLLSLVTGVLVAIWVSILGVDFPIFWGLVAFLLNYIPIIGSIVAAVPTALLTIAQHGLGRAALVVLGYLVINFLIGNLLEPLLMGRSFGLSTLVVFLALVFWGWVWGPLGMLLSVPLTIVLKIVLRHTDDFRWIAVLMSPGGQLEEAAVAADD